MAIRNRSGLVYRWRALLCIGRYVRESKDMLHHLDRKDHRWAHLKEGWSRRKGGVDQIGEVVIHPRSHSSLRVGYVSVISDDVMDDATLTNLDDVEALNQRTWNWRNLLVTRTHPRSEHDGNHVHDGHHRHHHLSLIPSSQRHPHSQVSRIGDVSMDQKGMPLLHSLSWTLHKLTEHCFCLGGL